MANPTRPRYKTTNIYSLMQAKGADEKVYHDPYRWSRGPRKADRILDVRGQAPAPLPVDRNAIVSGVFAVGRVGTVGVSGGATASVTGVSATGSVGSVVVVEPVDQFLLATGGVYGNPPSAGSTTLTPFRVYKQEVSVLTRLTDPSNQVSSGAWRTLSFSGDTNYLVGSKTDPSSGEPNFIVYSRSGDTFTKLGNPATLPGGSLGYACAASFDGTYFAAGSNGTPFIYMYKRTGTTLTKLSNPGTIPGAQITNTAFSSDATYLAYSGNAGDFGVYKRSGDTFTLLTAPGPTPASSNSEPNILAFSADDTYLYRGIRNGVISIEVYKRSGDTFTKLAAPASMSTENASALAASPDGKFVALGLGSTHRLWVYERSGDTFTKLADLAYRPANGSNIQGMSFSPDSKYLAVSLNASPYVVVYSISGTTFTRVTPSGLPTTSQYGVAYSNVIN